MGKTTNDPAKKKAWSRIKTARTFKESHTGGNVFKATDGTQYVVQAAGNWKKVK